MSASVTKTLTVTDESGDSFTLRAADEGEAKSGEEAPVVAVLRAGYDDVSVYLTREDLDALHGFVEDLP